MAWRGHWWRKDLHRSLSKSDCSDLLVFNSLWLRFSAVIQSLRLEGRMGTIRRGFTTASGSAGLVGKRSLLMFSGVQRFPIAGSFLIPVPACGTCVSNSLVPAKGGAEGMTHYTIMPWYSIAKWQNSNKWMERRESEFYSFLRYTRPVGSYCLALAGIHNEIWNNSKTR